jgi:aryl-alcohol dehydrogenase-like predicted oxidoreductase
MGCNRIGDQSRPDAFWVELIERAVELGVNLFDTSERYAKSRSEEMLGLALASQPDVLIATKAAPNRDAGSNPYTMAALQVQAEKSLLRLQRETIDIYQLHSPSWEEMVQSDWVEGMARLQEQGKVRYRAVAVRTVADGLGLIRMGAVDALQITYNIFETAAQEEGLFAAAVDAGVALLCRMPLARGVLTGKFRAHEPVQEGHRALMEGDRLDGMIGRAELLRPLAENYPGGMTRMAHHFSLTPPAVSTIIPGARTMGQLEENVSASNGVGLAATDLAAVERVRSSW